MTSALMVKPTKQITEAYLPFDCMKAHRLFPGRTTLMVPEVAAALSCTEQHVIDLINEGAINATEITGRGNKTSREHWRIPVGEFDAFVEQRRSDRKANDR